MQCIFIHNPKAAGMYIRKALSVHGVAFTNFEHNTSKNIRNIFGDAIWNDSFTFTFVRNPWDRLVSWYFYVLKFHNLKAEDTLSFYNFVDIICDDKMHENPSYSIFWDSNAGVDNGNRLDQHKYAEGVKFVGKVENFDNDLKKVLYELGVKEYLSSKPINTSTHNPYQGYYTEELIKKVEKRFEKDIDLFNYSYE